MNNMIAKSQMVGQAQQLRVDQTIKETDKTSETEKARTAATESSESSGSKSVNSNSGTARTAPRRRLGQDQSLQRLGRGQVEWSEREEEGQSWLPPSLQPHSKGAGTANDWNIPYWLMAREQPQNDSAMSQHKRLLNGLRTMVKTEIDQYTKQNEPLYAKKTLREIYSVLKDDGGSLSAPPPQSAFTMANEPAGFTQANIRRARNTFDMLENPRPAPGEAFEMVA